MKVLTFGEVMLRLKTPEHLKILQADTFEANYGGAEANVAVSLATLGDDVSYVTKVPEHQVGQAAVNEIRRFGVDTSRVLRGGGRVGIYYFEKGTNIRPTSVVYDRAYRQRQRNLTGKNCLMAQISFIFPVSRLPSAQRLKKRWRTLWRSAERKKSRWYVI